MSGVRVGEFCCETMSHAALHLLDDVLIYFLQASFFASLIF